MIGRNLVEIWWQRVRQFESEILRSGKAVDPKETTFAMTHLATGKMVYVDLRGTAIALANGSHRYATPEEIAAHEAAHNARQKQLQAAGRAARKSMVIHT